MISDQLGLRKPDTAIYQLTADKLGIPPAACVFVDDTERNLPAAETLGMSAVHFRESNSAVQEIEALLDL